MQCNSDSAIYANLLYMAGHINRAALCLKLGARGYFQLVNTNDTGFTCGRYCVVNEKAAI